MIRWSVPKYEVIVSLDVQDCVTSKALEFAPIGDFSGGIGNLKAEIIGSPYPMYGAFDESLEATALDLGFLMEHTLASCNPTLTEGQEIYGRYSPEPIPDGAMI
jgi:hypothetical protein